MCMGEAYTIYFIRRSTASLLVSGSNVQEREGVVVGMPDPSMAFTYGRGMADSLPAVTVL